MKSVYEATHSTDAHLVKNLLEQEGIASYIRGEFLQGGIGEIPVSGMISVCVDESDATRAREIVVDWDKAVAESHDPEDDEVTTETAKAGKPPGSLLGKAITLAVGASLGALAVWLALRTPHTEQGIDYNGDGIVDERAIFAGASLERVETDRNRDGRVDSTIYYDGQSLLSHGANDDDFDGRMETTFQYLHGQWSSSELDDNGDGAPEYRAEAIAGIMYAEEWLDKDGAVIKRVVYKDGRPSGGEIDADFDGVLDTRRYYDGRAEISRSEPMPKAEN